MKTLILTIGTGLVLAFSVALSPASAAPMAAKDCDARHPQVEAPGSATTETAPGDTADNTLTDKLATCGSVLNPPKLGDADIVEPTPPVGDDMIIHPDAPAARP